MALNLFSTAVPYWGQSTWYYSGLSPKRDSSSERVKIHQAWEEVSGVVVPRATAVWTAPNLRDEIRFGPAFFFNTFWNLCVATECASLPQEKLFWGAV